MESAVAATVGDDPVEVAEVQRMMDLVFHDNKKPAGDLLPMAKAQVLEEIVNRRLVLAYARRVGEAPSAEELAKAKKQLQIRLAAQGRKVSDVLKAESITAGRSRSAGPLAAGVGPLSGQVPHAPAPRDLVPESPPRSGRHGVGRQPHSSSSCRRGQPEGDRGIGEAGRIDPRRRSPPARSILPRPQRNTPPGPARKQGGRLGKIGRHGPMDESFSRAAFELKAGEISPPVRSPFGVHLIRCDEVLPGTKKLADLSGPIDEALAKELLEKISQLERQQTPVKYTSAWPHFKPGTRELAK